MTGPRPFPGDVAPDRADYEFWQACRDGRYLVFRCGACGWTGWPAGGCPRDGMADMAWVESSGAGRLHTWTVVHQQYATSFTGPPPNVAVVELDDGPFVHTTVVGAAQLKIGMRLHVAFDEIAPGVVLPVFRPAREEPENLPK
ncbi:Zn-ribbon domain-containing OB-fold protein [Amycolatopsis lurida]